MSVKYKIAATTYIIILLAIVLYCMMWVLGMKENTKPNITLITLIILAVSNILLLIVFPYVPKTNKKSIHLLSLLNLIFLLAGSFFIIALLRSLDFSLYSVVTLVTLGLSDIVLCLEFKKQLQSK